MPKTKAQCEQIRNERINSILRCSVELFATKGYDAVNLDEVTKKAKCSHGLLYHYFKNKEELYEAVLNQIVFPDSKEVIKDIDFNQKAKFVVHDIIDRCFKILKSSNEDKVMELYLLLNVHLQKSFKFIKKNEKGHTVIFATMEELIERGKLEGDFNEFTATELTIAVLSIIKGIAFNRINIGYKRFICPKSEIVMKMLLE